MNIININGPSTYIQIKCRSQDFGKQRLKLSRASKWPVGVKVYYIKIRATVSGTTWEDMWMRIYFAELPLTCIYDNPKP